MNWKRLLLAAICVLASAVVLAASLLPDGLIDFVLRPPFLAHFLAYLVLAVGFSFWWGVRGSAWIGLIMGLSLSGLIVELLQTQIPSRSFLWIDAAANAAGALTGAGLAWAAMMLRQRWGASSNDRRV